MYQSADFVGCVYAAAIQIQINNSFLVRINNYLPCRMPGFAPGTFPELSQYATNWAILAWINS